MYLAKIEEYFFKYRRQGTILSPQNWLIAERWEQMGIPINIVCKGIKNTCRQFRSAHKEGEQRIDVLTYCEPEILRLWRQYRKALLGAPESNNDEKGPDNSSEQHQLLETLRTRLKAIKQDLSNLAIGNGLCKDLRCKALSKLDWSAQLDLLEEEYCKEGQVDIDSIESRLTGLDNAYINNLLQLLSKEQRDELTGLAQDELSAYKEQMDREAYAQTLELSIKSLLRERFKLRRISLYAT